MNNKIVRISALFVLITNCIFAQQKDSNVSKIELDEVVISDSKFALSKEKSGKVITKITSEDLKKKVGQSVAAILSTVAGVEINGNQSRNGKDLGLYIRGGRNHQVLILIDGVPVTDASGITQSYDLRLLPVEQIESIEIMKGASSTLYGSGAGTGVINITLKKSAKKAIAGSAYMHVGTQSVAKQSSTDASDFNQGFAVNGTTEKVNYFASLNSTETTGISESKSDSKAIDFEKDAFSRVNSLMKIGFTPNKKLKLDFFANYDRMRNDFDAGPFVDDLKNYSLSEQYRVGFSPKYKYNKGEFVLNSGANLMNRTMFNFNTLYFYKSRSISADAFNKYEFGKQFFIVTGAQFQFHEMSNESPYDVITKEVAQFNMIDPYVTAVYNSDFGLNINTGARFNIHSKYGNNLVYNFNPSFAFQDLPLKVLASYSTAFVAPSLYQLYSPYGDLNLSSEKDGTAEAGFEVSLINKKLNLNVVAFWREEQDAIGFDLISSKYYNLIGKNKARGIETMLAYALNDKVKFNANYTFTELERQSSILNPKHKVNAAVDVQATARLAFNASYQFVSDRYFEYTIYPAPTYSPVLQSEILKDYQLVNANVRYELIKNTLNIFASADNILDKDFVESRGYSTRGRNFKFGFNVNF
ncbi:TonB-dependent siderophore receptor [Flavobacterium sp. ZT3R18]|uniref:TonB-dependent receptor plug domain-containing protein n=1 Tax=Flavobacterium sp. ZT3R18 TaxID=2594429 RepID=UPI00163D650C|nr:TonB-dependent receptor plug domain-containing protein [Flavobacterium sp. ZT3R18]